MNNMNRVHIYYITINNYPIALSSSKITHSHTAILHIVLVLFY